MQKQKKLITLISFAFFGKISFYLLEQLGLCKFYSCCLESILLKSILTEKTTLEDAASVSIKKSRFCYSATVWLTCVLQRRDRKLPSHLFWLYAAFNLAASVSFRSLRRLTLCYVLPKSIDLVSFWDQMAWRAINLSLHLSSSEERKIRRAEKRSGRRRRRRRKSKEGGGLGLNRRTGPRSPCWSFK